MPKNRPQDYNEPGDKSSGLKPSASGVTPGQPGRRGPGQAGTSNQRKPKKAVYNKGQTKKRGTPSNAAHGAIVAGPDLPDSSPPSSLRRRLPPGRSGKRQDQLGQVGTRARRRQSGTLPAGTTGRDGAERSRRVRRRNAVRRAGPPTNDLIDVGGPVVTSIPPVRRANKGATVKKSASRGATVGGHRNQGGGHGYTR